MDYNTPTNGYGARPPSTWWRWPLLPFAAVFGAALAMLAFTAFQWVGMKMAGGYHEDGWYYRYVMPVMNGGMFAYIYARISYAVAPTHKLIAGVVMVTLFGVLVLVATVIGWVWDKVPTGEAVKMTFGAVAYFFGMIGGLVAAHEEG